MAELPPGFTIDKRALPPGFTIDGEEPQITPRGDPQTATGEAALSMLTGSLSQIPAGLAGIGAGLIPGGRSGPEAVEDVSSFFTFKPRTKMGQELMGDIGGVLESGINTLRDGIETRSSGNPELAAATETLLLGAPAVLGMRGVKPAPRTRRQNIAAAAQERGYVVDPASANPQGAGSGLTGFGGKIKTQQIASQRNQAVTNRLVAKELGIPDGAEITPELLSSIRRDSARAYEAIRNSGRVSADTAYRRDLSQAIQKFKNPARDFPELNGKQTKALIKVAEDLRKDSFDAASAIDGMRLLRDRADAAFRKGRSAEAGAYRSLSDALEGAIERDLVRRLGPDNDIVANFRNARQRIAKTHSVQDALDGVDVSAPKLASQLNKGKPLTGELREIALFAQEFPKLARVLKEAVPNFSPLDGGTMALSFGASGLGGLAAGGPGVALGGVPFMLQALRPALRELALSKAGQRMAVRPELNAAGAAPGIVGSGALSDGAN